MDNKFLDKVVDQIVSETRMDYDEKEVSVPFSPLIFSFPFFTPFVPFYFSSFTKHCNEVYGLNDDEIEYVWNEYKHIIKDKIENNGL